MNALPADLETLHAAIDRRDAAFDRRFYLGVTSTRIVCRPVCHARTPKRVNRRFYATLEEATGAGFRPCKKCKPDMPAMEPGVSQAEQE